MTTADPRKPPTRSYPTTVAFTKGDRVNPTGYRRLPLPNKLILNEIIKCYSDYNPPHGTDGQKQPAATNLGFYGFCNTPYDWAATQGCNACDGALTTTRGNCQ